MPSMPPKPCKQCGRATSDPSGYCDAHRHIGEQKVKAYRKHTDERRGTACKRGYDSKWRKAREGYLRKHPLCVECEKQGKPKTKATVVDHIIPHRGDKEKFWDSSNWQPLCKSCHDRKTGRGE
ncbi:MAG: HNH endonuclease [Pseudodesulfovibrio sp.]|nr:HNH endonuclease [Pseudodesulfovibrio sp.]